MIKRFISYCRIKIYIVKHRWLKIPIVWYVGKNKGTMVVSEQPNFDKPLTWTKVVYKAGHIFKTPI